MIFGGIFKNLLLCLKLQIHGKDGINLREPISSCNGYQQFSILVCAVTLLLLSVSLLQDISPTDKDIFQYNHKINSSCLKSVLLWLLAGIRNPSHLAAIP